MGKIKIDNGAAFLYPMPMVLVGTVVEGKANFMAVGWVSRVNFKPPLLSIALGPHHTNKGIDENKEFSINIPDVSLIENSVLYKTPVTKYSDNGSISHLILS